MAGKVLPSATSAIPHLGVGAERAASNPRGGTSHGVMFLCVGAAVTQKPLARSAGAHATPAYSDEALLGTTGAGFLHAALRVR
jgi:hypothetical protein